MAARPEIGVECSCRRGYRIGRAVGKLPGSAAARLSTAPWHVAATLVSRKRRYPMLIGLAEQCPACLTLLE
jgi:hypothetical protein